MCQIRFLVEVSNIAVCYYGCGHAWGVSTIFTKSKLHIFKGKNLKSGSNFHVYDKIWNKFHIYIKHFKNKIYGQYILCIGKDVMYAGPVAKSQNFEFSKNETLCFHDGILKITFWYILIRKCVFFPDIFKHSPLLHFYQGQKSRSFHQISHILLFFATKLQHMPTYIAQIISFCDETPSRHNIITTFPYCNQWFKGQGQRSRSF